LYLAPVVKAIQITATIKPGRKLVNKIVAVLALLLGSPLAAIAATVTLTEVPTNWRLQNYVGGSVILWFTSAPCTNGQLVLAAGNTQADANRLWATILAAKLSSHKVFIYYDNAAAPGTCPISSFGMDD
jgi:hypothetical protein